MTLSASVEDTQVFVVSVHEFHDAVLVEVEKGEARLPRTVVAVLVGVNLSLSGAILQAVMKNPLADPHIIGISSGAGLFGIFVMMVEGDAGGKAHG